MKRHTKNLLFASLLYLPAFIAIILISMVSDLGIALFLDEETINPDTVIFIATVFFTLAASYAAYFVFYLMQRKIANEDINAKSLRLFPRIIGATVASAVSAVVLFICLSWISDNGEEISILSMNYTLLGVIFAVTLAVNFVSFICFKPRL
ncbi:MAG: hypothetical protein LBG43_09185 [Treponema sp.]|jgi:flagellar biosynthesis protein FliQ|nr:hypothetical protein [Treponema sp.]